MPSLVPNNGSITPSTSYSIRFWEVASVTNVHTELLACVGCSSTPGIPATQTRVTVRLPPRGVDVVPLAPRRFLVMPVLKPLAQLQPNGSPPYTEVATSGSITVSGKNEETRSGCHAYTQVSQVRWNCTTRRTYRNLRFVKDITVGGFGNVLTSAFTSWTTASATKPPHLPGTTDNQRSRFGPTWITSEPQNPPPF
jgi:hypothetical protein